ncbi:outer membrane usher protein FimD/PapC [Litorivivens lipolytica]|uniref:Outer membrane usher protein FimD/PapC n=1 Tax=Litorivivens lipolytica TaxID=1524264 RepID=A0A7W4Z6U5_9GAMM|nr:hypothetical protein [Litorivivens lipolytica]MBB3047236.1 outer membrane usher protein FimD/PapC [Litorivivens lipolytica]
MADFSSGNRRDILLVEGPDGKLYFPVTEFNGLVDTKAVLRFSENVHGCNPCIPLELVANARFDEATTKAQIEIFPQYQPAQRVVSTIASQQSMPLAYGGGFAAQFDLLGRYEERTDEEQYAIDADFGLSMGRTGNIYSSVIHFKDAETIRGQSFYEKFFDESLVNLQIGDVTTATDGFGAAVQLGGFRIRRSFNVDPDYNYRPFFKYATDARLPGTLELFIDGQRVKQQEYQEGRLEFESGFYSHGDELTLVLTDSIGNRRVIRQSLFDVTRNLAPGVFDFDIGYGAIREGENEYRGDYGLAWGSVGVTNNWTQILSYQGNGEFEQASTEVILSFGKSLLNLQGAWAANRDRREEGNSFTAQYNLSWGGLQRWGEVNAEYFEADRFPRFRRAALNGRGKTISLAMGAGRIYGNVSAFDIAGFTGGSVGAGYSLNNWYVEAAAEYLETDDYLATFTIGYRPQGRYKPRVRASHGWEKNNRSAGADITGSVPVGDNSLGYQLAAAQEYDRTSTVDSRAGLAYQGAKVSARASYSDVNSLERTSARLTTGFVISRHDAFLTSRPVSQSYATAVTQQRDVVVKGVGYSDKSGADGVASVPVPPFAEVKVRIDRDSLNRSDVLAKGAAPVRVAKGNYVNVDMPVMQSPLIIHILNNGVNDIFVNGVPFVHNDFGAYVTKYHPNEKNTLEVGGKSYDLVLPLVLEELPIYEFDRDTGRLYRISELFREH